MALKFKNAKGEEKVDPLSYISDISVSPIELPDTNCPEILRLLLNVDEKKSTGFDLISNKVIKATCNTIAPFLETLFNKCLRNGIFPDCFKTAMPKLHHCSREEINMI